MPQDKTISPSESNQTTPAPTENQLAAEAQDLLDKAESAFKAEAEQRDHAPGTEPDTAAPAGQAAPDAAEQQVQGSEIPADPETDPVEAEQARLQGEIDSLRTQLSDLREGLDAPKPKNYSGVFCGLGLLVLAVAIVGSAVYFNQRDKDMTAFRVQAETALETIGSIPAELESAQNQLNSQLQKQSALIQANLDLQDINAQLGEKVSELLSRQAANDEMVKSIYDRLGIYEEQNPNDWLISEAYFLVKSAYQKAVFSREVKTALWQLNNANSLLANINDEQVIAIRQAIANDIADLTALPTIDRVGIVQKIDSIIPKVNELILKRFLNPDALCTKDSEPSGPLREWKENLIGSAKEFASRFVEVRRQGDVAEYLSPDQDLYLRENIKVLLTLAKLNAATEESEAYSANLNAAKELVLKHFDNQSAVTTGIVSLIDELIAAPVSVPMPSVLKSEQVFSDFAAERVRNN